MRTRSASGENALKEIAKRHGFSLEATRAMLDAVGAGHGTMAQFDHREFGGSGQWMQGGMTMVSDMWNDALKSRINALCSELSALLAREPALARAQPNVSLRVPADSSGRWWPAALGTPASTGAQNAVRYAYFPDRRRLAIDVNGRVTVYDTLDHHISGFAQQQGSGSSLCFTSENGTVDVAKLPVEGPDALD